MQKLIKYLAGFSVFLSLVTIISSVICVVLIIMERLYPSHFSPNDFFMFELALGVITVAFFSLLQSLCILPKLSKK